MTEDRSSFRNILKVTSLFGGVQAYQILISVIRAKIVAILLGPAGIGIEGLLTSSIGMIQRATNFGLNISAVRDLAEANETGNQDEISKVIIVLRRLIWATGFLGLITALVLSPWLSELSFGNSEYTFAFAWISITLLFSQVSSGQFTVLQGMRQLRSLAKANLIGSSIGLLIGLPLYYLYGINGIVPNIIIGALSSMLISWFYVRKVKVIPISISTIQTYSIGKKMLVLGFFLNVTAFIGLVCDYIVRAFVSNAGGVGQVGLYTAGFAILNSYVGLIFAAMSTEYYPRLSGVAKDNDKCSKTINQQVEMSLIIMTPMIITFILFIHWGLILLYSQKFTPVTEMLQWAALGMLPRAAAWAIGYVYLAKGDSKLFITINVTTNIIVLVVNLISYHYYGLTGLGVSFAITNFLILLVNIIVSNRYYNFKFSVTFNKLFAYKNLMVATCFYLMAFSGLPYKIFCGIIVLVMASVYSFSEMNKRVSIKELISKYKK